jgi:Arc/MetJ family transcription regulator
MRTTLNLDRELVQEARELTGIEEKTTLIHKALRALIAKESAVGSLRSVARRPS